MCSTIVSTSSNRIDPYEQLQIVINGVQQDLDNVLHLIDPDDREDYLKRRKERETSIEHRTLYLVDSVGKKQIITLSSILGGGGSKKALAFNEEEVLLTPLISSSSCWQRIVKEESEMTDQLLRAGLMTLRLNVVNVNFTPDSDIKDSIPAYTTQSFKSLAKSSGCYIIDVKNARSSTWKGKLLTSDAERMKKENWYPILEPLIRDVGIIISNDFPISRDSLNLAIFEHTPKAEKITYQIRPFLFDFSDKATILEIPKIKSLPEIRTKLLQESIKIKHQMHQVIDGMLSYLFQSEFETYLPEILNPFRNELSASCAERAFTKLNDSVSTTPL